MTRPIYEFMRYPHSHCRAAVGLFKLAAWILVFLVPWAGRNAASLLLRDLRVCCVGDKIPAAITFDEELAGYYAFSSTRGF